MSWEFIDKVGVEIEGAWYNDRYDLIADGSIKRQEFSNDIMCCGELLSPQPHNNIDNALEFLQKNWPHEVNKKCGFHIHFSLKNIMLYMKCMNSPFYQSFLTEMERWGKDYPCTNTLFWERLKDKNDFCRKIFIPDTQVLITKKGYDNRYTHLNYCYGMHRTIECRLFPTFKEANTGQAALMVLTNFVEDYLKKNKVKERENITDEILLDEEEVAVQKKLKLNFNVDLNKKFKLPAFNYFQYKMENDLMF